MFFSACIICGVPIYSNLISIVMLFSKRFQVSWNGQLCEALEIKHLDTHRQRKRSSATQKCLQEHLKQLFIILLSFHTNTETAATHLKVQSN